MRGVLTGVLVIILLFSQVPSSAQSAGIPTTLEIQIHRLINDVRANKEMHQQDLAPLQLYSVLIDVARAHSKDMLDHDYFKHVDTAGNTPADRVSNAGIEYSSVAENLFFGQVIAEKDVAKAAVDGWVNSPGHYANIISPFAYTGIGVAQQGDIYYITQVFINADKTQLESIGRIYNNNELDSISQTTSNNNFHLTTQMKIILAIMVLVVMGLLAGRLNDRYYDRRR